MSDSVKDPPREGSLDAPFRHPIAWRDADPYDLAKAKALLAEAGFKDGVDLTHLLLNTTEYKQLGEALQPMLAESGIPGKFALLDRSQFQVFRRPPYPPPDPHATRG